MHPPRLSVNFANRTVWTADCLYVLRGMNSECVDLIYLDPPFNSKANYAAPIGSKAAGAEFKDTWTLSDIDVEWIDQIEKQEPALYQVLLAAVTDSDKSYLVYMAIRLLEMRRILKDTGSIYLHCDPTMSHYLKLVMDAIFGRKNFRNEIVWHYGGRGAKAISRQFARNKDVILYYSVNNGSHTFNKQKIPHTYSHEEARKKGFRKDEGGRWFKTSPRGDYTDESVIRLRSEGRIYETRTGNIRVKYFLEENRRGEVIEYKLAGDTWFDIPDAMHMSKRERLGYPTQKPLALLERIILASSNEGDLVLDPFCGCATTCVAAETLGRQWTGIDLSPKAAKLVRHRLVDHHGVFGQIVARTDLPLRTDLGKLPAPRTHRMTLYGQQGGNCAGCGEHFKPQHLEVDHIIASVKGGTDHAENLQLLCGHCNRVKGDRGMAYLHAKLQIQGGS